MDGLYFLLGLSIIFGPVIIAINIAVGARKRAKSAELQAVGLDIQVCSLEHRLDKLSQRLEELTSHFEQEASTHASPDIETSDQAWQEKTVAASTADKRTSSTEPVALSEVEEEADTAGSLPLLAAQPEEEHLSTAQQVEADVVGAAFTSGIYGEDLEETINAASHGRTIEADQAEGSPAQIAEESEPLLQEDVFVLPQVWRERLAKLEKGFIEHWVGILGSVILVAGVGFIGVYGALKVSPFYRFLMVAGFAVLLGGGATFLRSRERWQQFAGWLGSAAAAIFLFACFGSAAIPGLQWVTDHQLALGLLLLGIGVNIGFAWLLASQMYASIHSILSLLVLVFVPPTTVTLVLGTVVAAGALSFSFRYRWDRHLITVLLSYFAYVLFQKIAVGISPAAFLLTGKVCVVAIGLEAALIHYRKDYRSDGFKSLPALAHLLNWLLIGAGLALYSSGSVWQSIPVGAAAVALYFLSKKGKQLGIRWVYVCDMVIAEIFALVALFMLARFQVDPFLIAGLAFLETQLFVLLMRKEGDSRLDKISQAVLPAAGIALASFALGRLAIESHVVQDVLVLVVSAVTSYWFSATKKLDSRWSRVSVMVLAELFAIIALVSFLRLHLEPLLIAGLVFVETQLFFLLMRREADPFLDRFSRILVPASGVVVASLAFGRRYLESHVLHDTAIILTVAISSYLLAIKRSWRQIPWHFLQAVLVCEILVALAIAALSRWEVPTLTWSGLLFAETVLFVFLNMWHKNLASLRIAKHLMHLSGGYWIYVAFQAAYSYGQGMALEFLAPVLSVALFIFLAGWWFFKREGEKFEGINLYQEGPITNVSILWLIVGLVPMTLSLFFYRNPALWWFWEVGVCSSLAILLWVRSTLQINGLGIGCLLSGILVMPLSLVGLAQDESLSLWQQAAKLSPLLLMYGLSIRWSFIKELDRHVKWIGVYSLGVCAAIATGLIFYPRSEILPSILWAATSLIFLECALRFAPSSTKARGSLSVHLLIAGLAFLGMFLFSHLLINLQVEAYTLGLKTRVLVALFGLMAIAYWFFAAWPPKAERAPFFDRLQPFFLEMLLGLSVLTVALEVSSTIQPVVWMLMAGALLGVGARFVQRFGRLCLYSLLFAWTALIHTVVTVSTINTVPAAWYSSPWLAGLVALIFHGVYLALLVKKPLLEEIVFPKGFSKLERIRDLVVSRKNMWLFYPFFAGTALFLYWRFDSTMLTVLWVAEIFGIFSLSIILRENHFRILSLSALATCLFRLVFFDLVGTAVLTRGLVFVGVGGIMLLMNAMWVRFGKRFDESQ